MSNATRALLDEAERIVVPREPPLEIIPPRAGDEEIGVLPEDLQKIATLVHARGQEVMDLCREFEGVDVCGERFSYLCRRKCEFEILCVALYEGMKIAFLDRVDYGYSIRIVDGWMVVSSPQGFDDDEESGEERHLDS